MDRIIETDVLLCIICITRRFRIFNAKDRPVEIYLYVLLLTYVSSSVG